MSGRDVELVRGWIGYSRSSIRRPHGMSLRVEMSGILRMGCASNQYDPRTKVLDKKASGNL
jgi:hypothetical protein